MSGLAVATITRSTVAGCHAGALERLPRRRDRQVACRLVRSRHTALTNAAPLDDPVGVHAEARSDVLARDDPDGYVCTDAGDADRRRILADARDHAGGAGVSATANVSVPRDGKLPVHRGARVAFSDRSPYALELAYELQLVTRTHDALEADVLDAPEQHELPSVRRLGEHRHGAGLGQRLDDQHARHDRVAREVAGEIPLVLAHPLARHDPGAGLDLHHLVQEEEGIPVRDDRLDLRPREPRHAGECSCRRPRSLLRARCTYDFAVPAGMRTSLAISS